MLKLLHEGPGPKDTWLKYCGTAVKQGGKRRKQTSICVSGETSLLDSKKPSGDAKRQRGISDITEEALHSIKQTKPDRKYL